MNAKLAVIFFFLTFGFSMPVLLGFRDVYDIQLPNLHTYYQPEQPIPFSHRWHAGVLNMDCQYCHTSADHSRHAGIPNVSTCWNCHEKVLGKTTTAQENITKVRNAYLKGESVEWKRVHNVADFVYFNHQTHVRIAKFIDEEGKVHDGFSCQTCHGPMENEGVARQAENLSMGWWVNCHRDWNEKYEKAGIERHAPVNACDACHR